VADHVGKVEAKCVFPRERPILTPGGDVIREMIGAFPAATLAEGEYVAIARHAGKTTFKVVSGVDKDVEFLANETPPPEAP